MIETTVSSAVLVAIVATSLGFVIGFYAAFILAGKLCEKWEADDEPDLD